MQVASQLLKAFGIFVFRSYSHIPLFVELTKYLVPATNAITLTFYFNYISYLQYIGEYKSVYHISIHG